MRAVPSWLHALLWSCCPVKGLQVFLKCTVRCSGAARESARSSESDAPTRHTHTSHTLYSLYSHARSPACCSGESRIMCRVDDVLRVQRVSSDSWVICLCRLSSSLCLHITFLLGLLLRPNLLRNPVEVHRQLLASRSRVPQVRY